MNLEDLARELPRLQELAKALWGEEKHPFQIVGDTLEAFGIEHETYYRPKWQLMLQGMVVANDPLVYLGEHLDV